VPLPVAVCAALLLLCACCFFPGFFVVRRLHWTPLEKLAAAVGLSLILLYLATWTIYCFGPAKQTPLYWLIVVLTGLLAAVSARDSLALFRLFRIRRTLLAWAVLLAFTITFLCIVRVYGGAGWIGDWAEHFQRSLFFLYRLPPSTMIADLYAVPARPPLQNVVAAFFLGLTADRYEVFQIVFAFLNSLMFLACLLLMPALGFRKRRATLPLLFLFLASPAIIEQTTYTWTKAFSAFYVILAISFYLSGWRKNDPIRTAAAFLALAAGLLAHYSAGPYALIVTLHFAWRIVRARPLAWRDVAFAALPAALLLATWFGWSLRTYGLTTTVASNSSVTSADKDVARNVPKIAANLVDTIVPAVVRDASEDWKQSNADGRLRDQAFVFYQVNLIFAMGLIGGPVVLWLLAPRLLRRDGKERDFWRVAVPLAIVIGVAVVGERDTKGVAHLTLLPVVALGVTALASAFPRCSIALRLAIVAGCCLDFGLGVFLQARVEGLENTPREIVYPDTVYVGYGRFQTAPAEHALSEIARTNWMLKHKGELFLYWLDQMPRRYPPDPMFQASWAQLSDEIRTRLASDSVNWGGWFERNGGRLAYLGDHVAGVSGVGTDVASGILLLWFGGCLCLLVRQTLRARTLVPFQHRASRKSLR
jgi:hypothetical protein